MTRLGLNPVSFKDEQNSTPSEKANYEKVIMGNALLLVQMGEDHESYLIEKGITKKLVVDEFFEPES